MNTVHKVTTVKTPEMDRILGATIGGIKQQGILPDSPYGFSGPNILLCTGAWIVHVGLSLLSSEKEAVDFERELLSTSDKTLIVKAARKTGLSTDFVQGLIKLNDSLELSRRTVGVLDHLSGLRDGLACASS